MVGAVSQTIRECSAAGDLQQGLYSRLYRRDGDGNRITLTPEYFDEARARYDRNLGPFQLNQGGRLSWTVLQIACYDGNVAMVRHIIQLGQAENVDVVNFGGNKGVTPLITAVDCPDPDVAIEIARMLINAGADVNVCSNYRDGGESPGGITPVYLATLHAKERLVKLFLEAGAIVNPAIEQFEHDQVGCRWCHDYDPTLPTSQEFFESIARGHLEEFRENIGLSVYGEVAWTIWTRPMLDVVNRIGRIAPESLSLLAAIRIRQSQHEGKDLLKKGEEQGITLQKMLDPYLEMAEKLVCEREGSPYLEEGSKRDDSSRLPLWIRRF